MENFPIDKWAAVYRNDEFFCFETMSGYRGPGPADPKGRQHLLSLDANDETLTAALMDSLAHSRFVLPVRRTEVWQHPDVEYDLDLYDYKKVGERYAAWVKALMERYGYKTKRAMFKNMEHCGVTLSEGVIRIVPMRHVKPEAWEGLGKDDAGRVELPAASSPAEIGAALRLAFSRCTNWPPR